LTLDDVRRNGAPDWRERLSGITISHLIDPKLKLAKRIIETGDSIDGSLALGILKETPLNELTSLAHAIKVARFGNEVFFNSNLHVNPTNICVLACRFCAFRRGPKASDSYALNVDQYLSRITPYADRIDEVHSVGGLHPEWTIEHYEQLLFSTKSTHPHISLKCLTAVEVKHVAQMSSLSIEETLRRLMAAGLTSLPGGGAEILDDNIRARICNGKETSAEYLSIHETAHRLGLPTNCTMLFGTIESHQHRISHLIALRNLQDQTGGFQCFVPYPFLPDHSRLPDAQLSTGIETIRMIAISRLLLDSIPHIKAYRMNIGDHLAQTALLSGADDIDGTVGQEEIMHEAGSIAPLDHDLDDVARLIEAAGCIPVRRDTTYREFWIHRPQPPPPRGSGGRLPVVGSA